MPAVLLWVIGALGGAVAAALLSREARRINADLRHREAGRAEGPAPGAIPTLKRDPKTGVYRPH